MMVSAMSKMVNNEIARRIIQTRCGGQVERCHTNPHNRRYSNAQHQWGVAMLLHAIFPEHFSRLVLICLSHDVPEAWVGDIPSPCLGNSPLAKRSIQEIEQYLAHNLGLPHDLDLHPEDAEIVRACDMLDLYLWCREEWAMGNQMVGDCLSAIREYFVDAPLPEKAREVYHVLSGMDCIPLQHGVVKRAVEALRGGK